MKIIRLSFVALLPCILFFANEGYADPANPVTVVQTMETNFGVHPGFRRNHAKGVCALGEFKASPEAKKLSRSPIFTGKSIPVIARFSVAGGVPTISDATRNPRGMALQFQLADGRVHNITMLHTPVFSVSTPEGFLENLQATTPDPATGKPNPEKVKAFVDHHPESKPFAEYLKNNNPPASYASASYQSLHSFKFTDSANREQFVRWSFKPKGGIVLLSDADLSKAKPDFLEAELKSRASKGPLEWTMVVTIAEKGDSLTDPTLQWPPTRKEVIFGILRLTKVESQIGGACEKLNFDPMRLTDGVTASDDPVLKFRSPAYAVSFGKRLSEPAASKEKK